jgi:ABC-type oligopeptide transport system ATPase subunit
MEQPLLGVYELVKRFPVTRGAVLRRKVSSFTAVDGLTLEMRPGEALGLVGGSGCGKSTTARLICALIRPSSGTIDFEGRQITAMRGAELRRLRRHIQMVFQDPYSSLNPRKRAGAIISEPFAVHGLLEGRGERRLRACELMEQVGLKAAHHNRYPHEFSGGERQRIAIARAIALRPKLLLADEPVSGLDVSTQAQIMALLASLRRELGLSLLLISHDLAVVRNMCDRVAVMKAGKIVELAAVDTLYCAPQHPYTRELLGAVPRL